MLSSFIKKLNYIQILQACEYHAKKKMWVQVPSPSNVWGSFFVLIRQ